MTVNRERLAAVFTQLCQIDSPSRHEGRMAARIKEIFSSLEPEALIEDDSASRTGSECGNLVIRFAGSQGAEPLFFNTHLDTVRPGTGIRVIRRNDLFTSGGDTILGSDDKAGIAALIEAMRIVHEQGLNIRPVDLVFTTCEEIGLLGAKALDPGLIKARMGYALDTSGRDRVIIRAPACNRLRVKVTGRAAHAGLHPERGLNAIILAARALARVPCGRIDPETTINFGTIQGGMASNIVAETVDIEGEIRSHDPVTLAELTRQVEEIFSHTLLDRENPPAADNDPRPRLEFMAENDFPAMNLSPEEPVVRLIRQAARSLGRELSLESAGGGSDANIFNGYGLRTAIVATGMTHVHSTREQVHLKDMEALAELLLALLTLPA